MNRHDALPPTPRAVARTLLRDSVRDAIVRLAPEHAERPSSRDVVRRLSALRTSVTGHVDRRRAEGAPVECVLAELTDVVAQAERGERWRDPSGAVAEQVVRWSIDAYFDEPALRHVPRFY